jgi:hypothetical protein
MAAGRAAIARLVGGTCQAGRGRCDRLACDFAQVAKPDTAVVLP